MLEFRTPLWRLNTLLRLIGPPIFKFAAYPGKLGEILAPRRRFRWGRMVIMAYGLRKINDIPHFAQSSKAPMRRLHIVKERLRNPSATNSLFPQISGQRRSAITRFYLYGKSPFPQRVKIDTALGAIKIYALYACRYYRFGIVSGRPGRFLIAVAHLTLEIRTLPQGRIRPWGNPPWNRGGEIHRRRT